MVAERLFAQAVGVALLITAGIIFVGVIISAAHEYFLRRRKG